MDLTARHPRTDELLSTVKFMVQTLAAAGELQRTSLYRALAEAEEAAVDDHLPLRSKPVRIRRPGDPLTAEEITLRERLQSQPHPNTEIRS
ncbi:hypothetical protein OG851_00230 [Streptomyces sp. NBC_00161]|uniref:hypothetical protein n=1 Tax=Streptomyces sp. NBC_00161 TaxID=2975671 RepID=UPI003249B1C4